MASATCQDRGAGFLLVGRIERHDNDRRLDVLGQHAGVDDVPTGLGDRESIERRRPTASGGRHRSPPIVKLDVDEPGRTIAVGHEAERHAPAVTGLRADRERPVGHLNDRVRHVVETGKSERPGIGFSHHGQVVNVSHGYLLWDEVGKRGCRRRQPRPSISRVAPPKARRAAAISRRMFVLLETMISGTSGSPVEVA